MSRKKKNFFIEHLWDMANTLLALFAVLIGLMNYFSDMPRLSQDIAMELLATNPNNSQGDMLIFTVDYSNTGKQSISLKSVECSLFIGEKSYTGEKLNTPALKNIFNEIKNLRTGIVEGD